MNATLETPSLLRQASPFDLDDNVSYTRWRDAKLAGRARRIEDLIVDVAKPLALSTSEREAIVRRCDKWNMAVYRSSCDKQGKATPIAVGRQLGLQRLDANWLADEDGISSITVSEASRVRGSFIPYTDRPLKWHTDGYYHPQQRLIHAMLLHCVRPAASGGENALLDPELAYIALRDASPRWVRALMAPDAMTIPGREDDTGIARPACCGAVFSVDPHSGKLHMRYTARTRSIEWKRDTATLKAVAFLDRLLNDDNPHLLRLKLQAGMGIVANNVLHDRSAFIDDPARPRLIYRARFLDRIASPEPDAETTWRNG